MSYLIAAYGLTAISLIGYGIHLSRERRALERAVSETASETASETD